MSEPAPQDELEDVTGVVVGEGERLPALRAASPLDRAVASPAVQVAAMAATGLMAGAATAMAARHVKTHGLASRRRARRARRALPVVSSRSFLVDVHLLDPRG